MSKKITITRNEERYWVFINQEENLGIKMHEADLFDLIRSIRDTKFRNILYSGRFGVSGDKKSVIIFDYFHGKRRTCITLTIEQATRFSHALESSFEEEINSYSYHTPQGY